MRTQQAAKALGVDPKTIHNWLNHPMLNKFFSDSAAGRNGSAKRDINQNDLLILNTIHSATSGMLNNKKDWYAVASLLETGQLNRALPPAAMTVETGITDVDRWQDAIVLKAKYDVTLERLNDVEQRLSELERQRDRYVSEIMELREQKAAIVARLEMELELWRSGRLKPDP